MKFFRGAVAFVLLILGAFWATLIFGMENCTGGKADSLDFGILVAVLNIFGFALLGRNISKPGILLLAALPALVAAYYSYFTAAFLIGKLTSGMSSCAALTGLPFGYDGRESIHLAIWIVATMSFWLGLAFALRRSSIFERMTFE